MKTVIIAGGEGTRLKNLTKKVPKSLVNINKKTLLEYQIDILKKNGLKDILIIINHLGHKIKELLGDGKKYEVKITYFKEQKRLGTAGGIKEIEKLFKNDFLLFYGDILLNIDLKKYINQHKKNKEKNKQYIGTLVTHPNNHPYDSDLIDTDEKNIIKNILFKPHPANLLYKNIVNAGIYILSPKIFNYIKKGKESDFGKNVFPSILKRKTHYLYSYNTPEYIKDIGTPDRLEEAQKDILDKSYFKQVLSKKRPAIFLDRDGTINHEKKRLCNWKNFHLIKDSEKAIKAINKSNYYAIVITNQPIIAKGLCNIKDVLKIHKKMETDLGNNGTKLDAIYFCPHHPEKGFKGENKKYKRDCACRKPKTGLIKQATKDFNIDLENSYLIGDSIIDALTAKRAKIKFIGVKTGHACKKNKFSKWIVVDKKNIKKNLYAAVNHVLKHK